MALPPDPPAPAGGGQRRRVARDRPEHAPARRTTRSSSRSIRRSRSRWRRRRRRSRRAASPTRTCARCAPRRSATRRSTTTSGCSWPGCSTRQTRARSRPRRSPRARRSPSPARRSSRTWRTPATSTRRSRTRHRRRARQGEERRQQAIGQAGWGTRTQALRAIFEQVVALAGARVAAARRSTRSGSRSSEAGWTRVLEAMLAAASDDTPGDRTMAAIVYAAAAAAGHPMAPMVRTGKIQVDQVASLPGGDLAGYRATAGAGGQGRHGDTCPPRWTSTTSATGRSSSTSSPMPARTPA